jgi:hypothetical protein
MEWHIEVSGSPAIGKDHDHRQIGDMAHQVRIVKPRKLVVTVPVQLHEHWKWPFPMVRMDHIEAGLLAQCLTLEPNADYTHLHNPSRR